MINFESTKEDILGLRQRLIWLREVVTKEYPVNEDILEGISLPAGIPVERLEDIWSTTCKCAVVSTLTRLTEMELVMKRQPCWSIFLNTWVHSTEDKTNKYLKTVVCTSLDKINPKLHVKILTSVVCRAYEKGLVFCAIMQGLWW